MRRLLSVEEGAKVLNVSVHCVRRWLRLRRLPHHRVGRRVMLDEGDLERFVEAGRVEARE